jgi:hypothetical protein
MVEVTLRIEYTLRLLREAVEFRGVDYVDPKAFEGDFSPGCEYLPVEGNRCIVGEVLHRAGTSDEFIRSLDDGGVSPDYFGPETGFDVDAETMEVLYTAQAAQDHGESWGAALEEAEVQLEDARFDRGEVL